MRSVSVTKWNSSVLFIVWLVSLLLLSGCGTIDSPTQQAVAVLDKAIGELAVANADWQGILRDLARDLPAELHSTIGDVSRTLERAISASGTEVKCIVDFLHDRVREDLMRIKADLLDQPPPPLSPVFCSVESIDMARVNNGHQNNLLIFGYNFDVQNQVQMMLNENGQEVDVNADKKNLFVTTHYRMELNLGSNGLQLTPKSQYLLISWDGQVMSEIPIIQPIQPELPVCVIKDGLYTPTITTLIPDEDRHGDADFGGHGPFVLASVTLIPHADRKGLDLQIFMSAIETEWGNTSVSEIKLIKNVYATPEGYIIDRFDTGLESNASYTDTDWDMDPIHPTNPNGPVRLFSFIGDVAGNEAGSQTQVTVEYNVIRFRLRQVDNCK